ncbi:MAG: cyclic nucleotide-binding domain-containing protein [Thermodesulfobacteriota bacterium]
MANVVLKGSLGFIGLGDLLQQLGGSGSSGVIKLDSAYAKQPGYIYLKDGNPINAEYGSRQGLEALNGFFGWTEAEFEFLDEAVTCEPVIKKSRMEIILDGLRMVDDGLIETLGPQQAGDTTGQKGSGADIPSISGPVIDYVYVVDEEEFSDGSEIVAQDRFGNWFWVVLSGTVEVIRHHPEGRATIVHLTDGAYIGSIISFLRSGNIRSASIKAVGNVQLGVLDSELIAQEYSVLTDDFQNVLVSMDQRLKQVTDVCARAVLGSDIRSEPGRDIEVYLSEETNENAVFRIVKGEAYVLRKTENEWIHLCTLGPGDFIGQIPFLNTAHEPHSASVYVSDDFDAEPFDIVGLKEEYDRLSQTFTNMIANMATSISITTGRILDLFNSRKKT